MGIEWSKVTGLKVFVTQAQYEAGQHVSGEVFANLLSELEFSKLILDISGVEAINYKSPPRRCESENDGPPKMVEAREQKELFQARAVLFEPPQGRLPPGRYRFPFLFVLPQDIPGSASVAGADVGRDEAGEYSAEVKYLVRAELEDCFIFVKDLHGSSGEGSADPAVAPGAAAPPNSGAAAAATAEEAAGGAQTEAAAAKEENAAPTAVAPSQGVQTGSGMSRFPLKLSDMLELIIVESPKLQIAPHHVDQMVTSRRFVPCMKPHIVTAALCLENTVLIDGDVFEVNAEIENPSRYTVSDIVLAVWRVTTLKARGLRPYVVRNRMLYQQVSAVPPGCFFKGEDALHVDIQIPNDLQPTVQSSLFDVKYEVALTADFRKGGIDIRDPLVIMKRSVPQSEHLKTIKAPPGWETVDISTDIIRIQVEGAPAPDIGNYEGIGYVRPPQGKATAA